MTQKHSPYKGSKKRERPATAEFLHSRTTKQINSFSQDKLLPNSTSSMSGNYRGRSPSRGASRDRREERSTEFRFTSDLVRRRDSRTSPERGDKCTKGRYDSNDNTYRPAYASGTHRSARYEPSPPKQPFEHARSKSGYLLNFV